MKDHVRRSVVSAALGACALVFAAAPAQAAFCGPSADVAAIEKLTIATYGKAARTSRPIDDSYVRIIDVTGTYAYSLTDEDAGPIAFYWQKEKAVWTYVPGQTYPTTWPPTIRDGFDKAGTGMRSGNTMCANPNWRNRSSG